jgi:hypothetical protein
VARGFVFCAGVAQADEELDHGHDYSKAKRPTEVGRSK